MNEPRAGFATGLQSGDHVKEQGHVTGPTRVHRALLSTEKKCTTSKLRVMFYSVDVLRT